MSDSLEGPKLKIERAKKQIIELEASCKRFLEANPIEMFTERDPQGVQDWYVVRLTKEPPGDIKAAVGGILYELRSSLDQLACALARKNGATSVAGVYFPFAGSKNEFESERTQRQIKKLSAEAISVVHALKPYKGGNDLLWSLNKLCNIDKHQSLIGAAMSIPVIQGTGTMLAGTTDPLTFKVQAKWDRFAKEIKVFGFPSGRNPEYEGKVTIEIAFRDVDMVGGYEVIATLTQLCNLTMKIVYGMEARFFRD